MEIDKVIIIIVACSALAIMAFVGIFAAIFHRKLGTSQKQEKNERTEEEDELLETQQLAPAALSDTQIGYTTTNVQPLRKNIGSMGYPHGEIVAEQPQGKFPDDWSDDSSEDTPPARKPDAPELTTTLTILLRYDRQRNYLLLKLINLFDLPVRRDQSQVNAYLEIRVLPHFGQNPIQTEVYMNNRSPKLNETFEFEVESEELRSQKLEFVLMDAREYSNRSIGFAELSIDSLNMNEIMAEKEINTVVKIGKPVIKPSLSLTSLSSDIDSGEEMVSALSMGEGLDYSHQEASLPPRKTKGTVRLTKDWDYVAGMEPMILLSLYYDKQTGKLLLAIVRVSDLKMLPNNKKPDTYVKVFIYIGKKLRMKKKTVVVKNELNPTYNQKLQFPVAEKDLEKVSIELVVKNSTRGRGNPTAIHKLSIGNSSTGVVLEHWKSAITSAKPVTMWHNLS